MSATKLVARMRRRLSRSLFEAVSTIAGTRVVPLRAMQAIRLFGPLEPASISIDRSPVALLGLAKALGETELGRWALGPRSIEYLVEAVYRHRPTRVIEFGSGASTVALAWALRQIGERRAVPQLISLEQDETYANETRSLLARAGLERDVAILVRPIAAMTVEGVRTECYDVAADLNEIVRSGAPELIVIDGPAGIDGARFATLPMLHGHVHGLVPFLLYDALRDGELNIAKAWRRLPYIDVDGVRLIEKGILCGSLRGGP